MSSVKDSDDNALSERGGMSVTAPMEPAVPSSSTLPSPNPCRSSAPDRATSGEPSSKRANSTACPAAEMNVEKSSPGTTDSDSADGHGGRHRLLADLTLLTTAVLWGINIVVVKAAVTTVNPLAFNSLRMILSAMVLGTLAMIESRFRPAIKGPFSWRRAAAFVVVSGIAYPLIFMFGIERTTAGNTALLLASMPVWTAVLSFIFLHERLPKLTWFGLAISLVGTVFVVASGGKVSFSIEFFAGNLIVLAAAVCWSTATVISGPVLKNVSPLWLAFITSAIATPTHLLIASPELPAVIARLDETSLVLALCYSGIMSTGIAYATWQLGVSMVGGSHAAVYQNLVTLVAVLAAWFFLQEAIVPAQIAGGVVLFVGLFCMRRGRTTAAQNAAAKQARRLQDDSERTAA